MNFNLASSGDMAPLFILFAVAVAVLSLVVHVAFALAVYDDAGKHRTLLVGPAIWTLATLLGGVFVAAVYWAMHHSTLRVRTDTEDDGTSDTATGEYDGGS